MIITEARIALSATESERFDLSIGRDRILPFGMRGNGARYDLTGHLLLPGLINAHDHLDFNLFPRLGNGPYPNASAWAADIYRPDAPPIQEHLRVPKSVRLVWGGLKNLLSGVTTVAHHDPYHASVFERNFPVRIVKRFGWAHSLDFSPDLAERHRRTRQSFPFVVHAAEGTDERAHSEIRRLDRIGVLGERTVLVHAVAIDACGLDTLLNRRCSVVWCPSSNLFTCGQTMLPATLRSGVPITLGTDSALTAEGDLVDEIRVAKRESGLSSEHLYEMVTAHASRILRLNSGTGSISEGGIADLVAVADHGQTPAESLTELRPELVLIGGRVKLISDRLARRGLFPEARHFHPISIQGRGRFWIETDVPLLYHEAAKAIGPEYRLAGKRVTS